MPTSSKENSFRNSFQTGSQVLRKGRESIENQIYFITFTTKNRKQLFSNFEMAAACSFNLSKPEVWPSAKLLCWVLMPDHFHGLVQLNEKEPLEIVVGRLKAHLTRLLGPQLQLEGRCGSRVFTTMRSEMKRIYSILHAM